MQIIYKAADIVEAHIVAGMLKSEGIEAYVGGHYLQGAIGDLSPLSFANVFVDNSDVHRAATLVREYEQNSLGGPGLNDDDDSFIDA
jgi:hypothetical protein